MTEKTTGRPRGFSGATISRAEVRHWLEKLREAAKAGDKEAMASIVELGSRAMGQTVKGGKDNREDLLTRLPQAQRA